MKDEKKMEPHWEDSDSHKEWTRLAHINHPEPIKCGYWYYDNVERIYKYVTP